MILNSKLSAFKRSNTKVNNTTFFGDRHEFMATEEDETITKTWVDKELVEKAKMVNDYLKPNIKNQLGL